MDTTRRVRVPSLLIRKAAWHAPRPRRLLPRRPYGSFSLAAAMLHKHVCGRVCRRTLFLLIEANVRAFVADEGALLQSQALAAQPPLQEVLHAEGALDECIYLR